MVYKKFRLLPDLVAAICPRLDRFLRLIMRRFFKYLASIFANRRTPAKNRHLLGMYFGESNSGGRRKSNRDRA
jgi:hypothetical protein